MKHTNLESFCPKLRSGRVIPQGSRIIFETDNPYNQVILPMALADLILLCSGQFSIREIVEKIYKKQGAVPFKSILAAVHVLHQGGFFENGHELVLSSDLQSWMEPKRSRWALAWRFGQRIVADKRSPTTYYVCTLIALIASILGLQFFPSWPLQMAESWAFSQTKSDGLIKLLTASSVLLTLKYALRGWQLLLLTGKAYNVSMRLSPWGLHLHVGNEANDLFENRLYTVMFYISQIMVPWTFIWIASFFMSDFKLEAYILMGMAITFWDLNPFVSSDGLKLIQSLLLPSDRDVASWHFEANQLIDSISDENRRQDQDFARICAIWGAVWLVTSFAMLHDSAITFGPAVLKKIMSPSFDSLISLAGLGGWLFALYRVVQAMVETVAASLIRPHWRKLAGRVKQLTVAGKTEWTPEKISTTIEALPLFSHFHEQYLRALVTNSEVMEFNAHSSIIGAGEPSRELYVLLEGEVLVARPHSPADSNWTHELSALSVFGESALVDDKPRMANVTAKTKVTVLRVPIHILRQVAHEAQSVRHLEDFRNAILVNQFFASSPVFRSLSTESIEFLSSRGSLEYFDQDQVVFRQGDAGDSLFLILRGTVDVVVHATAVKTLSQGNFFGEIALIANIPRTATILTREPSVFFRVSSNSFWEVLVRHIDLGVFLETISESRLREDLELAPPAKTGTGSN